MITSILFQWSSSHEERAKVIQEGLMNPLADILKAIVETEAAHPDITPKPAESLEQVTVHDIEKLLSKLSELSESLLLQLRQSLAKEWGPESMGTLPEDSIQKLLTEVGFI